MKHFVAAVAVLISQIGPASATDLQCASTSRSENEAQGAITLDLNRQVVVLELLPRAAGMLEQVLRIETANDQLISARSPELSALLDRYTGQVSITRRFDNASFELSCELRQQRF